MLELELATLAHDAWALSLQQKVARPQQEMHQTLNFVTGLVEKQQTSQSKCQLACC